MADRLSGGLVAKLGERARSASERSDSANLGANSESFEDMLGGIPKSDDPAVREYLEGMNSPFAGMIANMVCGDGSQAKGMLGMFDSLLGGKSMMGMMGDRMFASGGTRSQAPAPPPCSEAEVASAESKLGFALPGDLRHFYLEVANGGVGPGDGIYGLDELLAKWREMTDEPVGPRGQKWPKSLLPIEGDGWDLTSIDLESGALVAFDPEEIDYGGWKKAFSPEAESLEAWLESWLGSPGAHRSHQDEMTEHKAKWAEEWIEKLESKSEAHRASHGFHGDDWRDQVRRRAGAPPRDGGRA